MDCRTNSCEWMHVGACKALHRTCFIETKDLKIFSGVVWIDNYFFKIMDDLKNWSNNKPSQFGLLLFGPKTIHQEKVLGATLILDWVDVSKISIILRGLEFTLILDWIDVAAIELLEPEDRCTLAGSIWQNTSISIRESMHTPQHLCLF